ncbi:MAG: T9SS type A sorting domain-containing protein [Bacteroidota bacterium]
MTNHAQFLLCSFFALMICFSSCFWTNEAPSPPADKWDEKMAPHEDFHLQRSYPDPFFNLKAYEKGVQEARDKDAVKGIGFDNEWTVQGPGNIGARANTVAVHPTNDSIIFTGFSSGGVWRTTDGGANWEPVFDDQLWPSVADIVFDPSNPSTIYVGTGDPNISFYPMLGDGVYKSTDGGDTWTNIGLQDNRVIPEILVHPTNPDIIFAASMGLPFIRDNNRGLYRTTDGGNNWEQVLFISDSTGITDIQIDPFNPDVIYASGWDRVRNNVVSLTTGEGANVYKSVDGGDSWTQLGGGLPEGILGRTGLAHSQITPNLVYAMFVGTNQQLQGVYKSEDAGDNWTPIEIIGLENALGGFGWYFGKLRTHRFNDEEIFILGVELWRGYPNDGIWEIATPDWWLYDVHADKHDLTFTESGNIYLATDGGLYRSPDNGTSWVDIENIPTTQFYRVAFNPHQPDWYYGGAQDNGTTGGNDDMINNWPRIWGGDGFKPVFHPTEPDIFYVETQRGNISVTVDGGIYFEQGDAGIDNNDRRDWDMPYLMSAHNPDVLYAGTFRVYKSENGTFPLFSPISESLTDSVTLATRYHTITTLSESPIQQGLLYAGTVDANVWRTDDDGENWINITNSLPERYVTEVKASPTNVDWAYVTHSGYKDNEFIPRVHRSKDRGATWEDISNDLPDIAVNDIYILPNHEDSVLFVATDAGVYGSINRGENWTRMGNNMPFVPSFDIDWNPFENTVIAGTFARSIMTYPIDSLLFAPPVDTSTSTQNVVAQKLSLEVFPNPATARINVRFPSSTNTESEIVIFDKSGKLFLKQLITGEVAELNVSALPPGEYFVKGKTGHIVRSGRFVKI